MLKLIQCEIWKIKRMRFIWLALGLAILFPLVLTAYVYNRGSNFTLLSRFTFLYGDLLFKPCILGIFGVMLLAVESDNGTFKNLNAIPVSRVKLFYAKLFVLLMFSVFYSGAECLATLGGGILLGDVNEIPIYLYSNLMISILLFLDVLPITLLFCIFNQNKVFCVISSLFYAIAGFLLVNSYANGMSVSNPIVSTLPRVVVFRWFLQMFSLGQGASGEVIPTISTSSALVTLLGIGAILTAVASLLYGRKEAN